jgi:hypothetical protein
MQSARRVERHRRRAAAAGKCRVEVAVPAIDAPLVRRVASMLRHGGDTAEAVRKALRPVVQMPPTLSGTELVAFFRASPLVGTSLEIERDRSAGRPVDLA